MLFRSQSSIDVRPERSLRPPTSTRPAASGTNVVMHDTQVPTSSSDYALSTQVAPAESLFKSESHLKVKAKRFVPLVARTVNPGPLSMRTIPEIKTSPTSLIYLDFTSSALPTLKPIDMPPSLSQRKHVQAWSIILSGLSDSDRRQCSLVSRLFRYAGLFHEYFICFS